MIDNVLYVRNGNMPYDEMTIFNNRYGQKQLKFVLDDVFEKHVL